MLPILELDVRPEWEGKTILELDLRRKYSINIVAICENSNVSANIDPAMVLNAQMKLIVIANTSKLSKLT